MSQTTEIENNVIDEDEEEKRGENDLYSWSYLPDLIMEKVFSQLSMREKYYASQVCREWFRAFYLPKCWSVFVFDETTLTRRRFNYYSGWQYILDHLRTQLCLTTIGRNFKVLVFLPRTNFYNMYEFMNMISFYAEQEFVLGDKCLVPGLGKLVHTLKYTFPCNMSARQEEAEVRSNLYGTGGKLLAAVKRLMANLPSLRRLELIDLMLDTSEALVLLDQVCCDCCETLETLALINPTKIQCQLLHVGVFINLEILKISPQNLAEDVLYLLSETRLKHLHIVQNRYTTMDAKPVCAKAWAACAKKNKGLRVHLSLECLRERSLLWQERAPVTSILFSSPQAKLVGDILSRTTEWYSSTLSVFAHLQLPRFHQPRSFNERMDPFLLMLVKECPSLHTLIIRERISTATALLLAEHGRRLEKFYVRKNAVILRCDWPRNPDWSAEYYHWLKHTSRSYEKTEIEVGKILSIPTWHMLSDKEFKNLTIDLY